MKLRSWQERKAWSQEERGKNEFSKSDSSLQAQGLGGCGEQSGAGIDHYWCHIRDSQSTLAQGWHCANGQNTAKLPLPYLRSLS